MRYDLIIDQQLDKTRRRVKLVDLGGIVMVLIGFLTLYTMVVVLIDHWLVELSTLGRFLALGILIVAGLVCYTPLKTWNGAKQTVIFLDEPTPGQESAARREEP